MRFDIVLRYMGMVLLLDAIFMFASAMISLQNNIDTGFYPLLLSFILTVIMGLFPLIFVGKSEQITNKEGYAIVVGSWILSSIVGTFPFMLWGGEFDLVNSWFESVSGYTTTGSTILRDVEALPRGLLFWRSSTHLLGGLGVVMFALVVLPALGKTKLTLSSVELSPLAKDNYRYRTQKMVEVLLVVYVGMVIAETILLKVAGMTWFDSINHSFSTIATGGFSTKNASVGHYGNLWVEIIITVFMLLSSIHFGIIFATLTGKANNLFRSEVSRYYIICLVAAGGIIALSLWINDLYPDYITALRYSMFQVIAMASTSGFATADANLWSSLSLAVLVFIGLQCACAGSTGGGIKADRVMLAFKVMRAKILQQQHPNAIIRIKLNNIVQENDVVNFAMVFVVVYIILVMAGTILLSALGLDIMTAFSATFASMGNIGPGFGEVGTMGNYASLPDGAKLACTFFMLLGRLEIFGFIQLFLISWWK